MHAFTKNKILEIQLKSWKREMYVEEMLFLFGFFFVVIIAVQ